MSRTHRKKSAKRKRAMHPWEMPRIGFEVKMGDEKSFLKILLCFSKHWALAKELRSEAHSWGVAKKLGIRRETVSRGFLKPLADEGLLEVKREERVEGRTRKYYGYTYLGRKIFELLWECKQLLEEKPPDLVMPGEVKEVVRLLESSNPLDKSRGWALLDRLVHMRRGVLNDERILNLLVKSLDSPEVAERAHQWTLAFITSKKLSLKFVEENFNRILDHFWSTKTKSCWTALHLIQFVDETQAMVLLCHAVKFPKGDARWDDSLAAWTLSQFSPDKLKDIRRQLAVLTRHPSKTVAQRAHRLYLHSLMLG